MKVAFKKYTSKVLTSEEQILRSEEFYKQLNKRRSIRTYDSRPIPEGVLENIIMTAGTAPSGAHKQPWSFCVVKDPALRKKLRVAVEQEEYENYNGRMSDRWLEDLEVFETNHQKPFIENASALIVVFKKSYEQVEGEKRNNYYVNESVGIATGMLISAIHNAGLVCLTHTPSPMNFLAKILERPENERAFLLLPVGYPAADTAVPDIQRKRQEDILFEY